MLNIISLPSEYKYFTLDADLKIRKADIVVVQTSRTPCFEQIDKVARATVTLDSFFNDAESFEELYVSVARYISDLSNDKNTVFCILGQPSNNGFVEKLKDYPELEYTYGGNQTELAAFYGSIKFNGNIYKVIDARDLKKNSVDTSNMQIITGIENNWVLSDVKLILQEFYNEETQIILINGACGTQIPLSDLKELNNYGAGTAIVIGPQPLLNKKRYCFNDLLNIMAILAGPGGCPWDAEQTHQSLIPYLIEESYEVADAVESKDTSALYDELGDVLLQVVFHSEIANKCSEFDISDVITAICNKLIKRHPHIFGDISVNSSEEVLKNWEAIKRDEKGFERVTQSLLDIPQNMGALMRAAKIQKKAAAVGFDWQNAEDALEKIKEETNELSDEIKLGDIEKIKAEGGDLLFAVVNVLRKCKINSESALKSACDKFIKRFSYIEKNAEKEIADMTLKEMDALWELSKSEEDN